MKILHASFMFITLALAGSNAVASVLKIRPAETAVIINSAAAFDRMLESVKLDAAGSVVGSFGNGLKLYAQSNVRRSTTRRYVGRPWYENTDTRRIVLRVIVLVTIIGIAIVSFLRRHFKGNNMADVPSTPTKTVSNWPIWTLAIFPPLVTLLFGIFSMLPALIVFFAGGYFDAAKLRKAGYDPTPITGVAWFPPVYLYKRSKFLNCSLAPFIVHLVLWGLSMFVYMILIIIAIAMFAN